MGLLATNSTVVLRHQDAFTSRRLRGEIHLYDGMETERLHMVTLSMTKDWIIRDAYDADNKSYTNWSARSEVIPNSTLLACGAY